MRTKLASSEGTLSARRSQGSWLGLIVLAMLLVGGLVLGAAPARAAGVFSSPQKLGVAAPAVDAVGDFNGDGTPDVAIASVDPAQTRLNDGILVTLGNGDGTFRTATLASDTSGPWAIATGDFNGDGKLDVTVANRGPGPDANTVGVFLGNGDGSFQAQRIYNVGSRPTGVVAADFNGDGKPDLAVTNFSANTVSVLLGNGDGTFQPQQTYGVGNNPQGLVLADFNGDGKSDLAVANGSSPNTVSVLIGNGNGTFQPQQTYTVGAGPTGITAGDFNGDGNPDIAVSDGNGADVIVGNGDGSFGAPVSYTTGSFPYAVAAADFNGDGKSDLIVSNANDTNVSLLIGNGDGTFQTQQTYLAGAGLRSLAVGDFNRDTKPDVAVMDYNENALSILLNQAAFPPVAAFTFSPTAPTTGQSVAFDGTGSSDPDGTISAYSWNFGDGSSSTAAQPSHAYATAGTYTVKLTVTDNSGNTNTTSQQLTVTTSAPPTPKEVCRLATTFIQSSAAYRTLPPWLRTPIDQKMNTFCNQIANVPLTRSQKATATALINALVNPNPALSLLTPTQAALLNKLIAQL